MEYRLREFGLMDCDGMPEWDAMLAEEFKGNFMQKERGKWLKNNRLIDLVLFLYMDS